MTLYLYGMIGLVFGFLAGCIAFFITYNEYEKHQFKGRRLWREAFGAGLFAFIFFLVLSVALGYYFTTHPL